MVRIALLAALAVASPFLLIPSAAPDAGAETAQPPKPVFSGSHRDLELFALDVAAGTERRLTRALTQEYAPALSPDRQRVAFAAKDGLRVMAVDGSGVRLVPGTRRGD